MEVKSKIPDITNLATEAALDAKVADSKQNMWFRRFFTTSKFNRLTKINYWCKTERGGKGFANKSEVGTGFDIVDKNRKKK